MKNKIMYKYIYFVKYIICECLLCLKYCCDRITLCAGVVSVLSVGENRGHESRTLHGRISIISQDHLAYRSQTASLKSCGLLLGHNGFQPTSPASPNSIALSNSIAPTSVPHIFTTFTVLSLGLFDRSLYHTSLPVDIEFVVSV